MGEKETKAKTKVDRDVGEKEENTKSEVDKEVGDKEKVLQPAYAAKSSSGKIDSSAQSEERKEKDASLDSSPEEPTVKEPTEIAGHGSQDSRIVDLDSATSNEDIVSWTLSNRFIWQSAAAIGFIVVGGFMMSRLSRHNFRSFKR